MPKYEPFTRKPVEYLPVLLDGQPIGYLWASETDAAASFVRRLDTMRLAFEAPLVWAERLDQAGERDVPAREAIRGWIGAPQDPRAGAVPPGVSPQRADSPAVVERLANPDVPPSTGPIIQDGELPDGTPIDRSKGWGPLHVEAPPTYPTQASGPVVYRTVVAEGGLILGYLWASGDAASYVARADAGLDGTNRAVGYYPALREAFAQGVPALDAIRSLAPDAAEAQAPSLDDLIRTASRYEQSLHLAFPLPDPALPPRPPLPPADRDAVLAYLEQAPVAFPAGAPAPDFEDAARPAVVPSGYRTDGTWVWPEALAYYLRVHAVSPDPDLVAHIRANAGRVPEVSPESVTSALRTLKSNGILSTPPIA
ncbi:hypothetical protein [Actinomadura harenae]|uniref:Uncharacterized protein n=1 Tax=Actinomadura harenae TaxID=2483351 RepID=A0A3M2LLB4_9ACTN|nr:hypothetical protein [Actinomadura harenae]RMI36865.1 hypothetical protein EBO15_37455 [Actinomadura harenae]